ncbi:proton-coupled folate transporter-like [Tigriopus californicus]|uniref:proton-coupled folate transporter-like n=1 Tax=Tigriopus californicus TaxID=6832 RepID=UPI0027DA6D7E|nr:proton-coupled folate transporter-like [Tigriopus californicus]
MMIIKSGSISARLRHITRNITVEPVIVLYLISIGLNEVIRPNLLIQKACRQKLNFSEDLCNDLNNDNHTSELDEVQQEVSNYEGTLSLAAFFPRVIYALIAGAWSDRFGRKFIIGMPVFGQVLLSLSLLLNYAFLLEFPFGMLYLEFLNELCGSFVLYYLGIYSYISDVTSNKNRTTRLSFADGTDYISTMIGTSSSGPLFKFLGFYFVFGASATLSLCAVVYLACFVQESKPLGQAEKETGEMMVSQPESYGAYDATPSVENLPRTKKTYCQKLPFPSDFLASFKTILKPRAGHGRLMIWMLLFNFACYIFAYNGTEGSHRYLFATKKYGWDEQEFTVFLSIYRILYLVTLWLILPVLSRYFQLHDACVAIIACITGAVGMGFPALIEPSWAFFLGSFISSFSPAATIVVRSMASRCVEENEVGRVFAMISFISAISSSLITAAFQAIYSTTLNTFPETFLLVNAAFFVATIPNNIFLWNRLRSIQQN